MWDRVVYYSPRKIWGVHEPGMKTSDRKKASDPISNNMYIGGSHAGPGDLVDVSGLSSQDMEEINDLMKALVRLRDTEQAISEASRRYMKLSSQDMRALHYLIVAKKMNKIVTPGMIAAYLRISAASTTKLLNRLEREHHLVRNLHPTDRRAFAIEITPATEASAQQTVGKLQARRLYAAARLTSSERSIVTRFLNDMSDELALDKVEWATEQPEDDANSQEQP